MLKGFDIATCKLKILIHHRLFLFHQTIIDQTTISLFCPMDTGSCNSASIARVLIK